MQRGPTLRSQRNRRQWHELLAWAPLGRLGWPPSVPTVRAGQRGAMQREAKRRVANRRGDARVRVQGQGREVTRPLLLRLFY